MSEVLVGEVVREAKPGTPAAGKEASRTSATTPRAPPAISSGGTRTRVPSPGGAGRSCSARPRRNSPTSNGSSPPAGPGGTGRSPTCRRWTPGPRGRQDRAPGNAPAPGRMTCGRGSPPPAARRRATPRGRRIPGTVPEPPGSPPDGNCSPWTSPASRGRPAGISLRPDSRGAHQGSRGGPGRSSRRAAAYADVLACRRPPPTSTCRRCGYGHARWPAAAGPPAGLLRGRKCRKQAGAPRIPGYGRLRHHRGPRRRGPRRPGRRRRRHPGRAGTGAPDPDRPRRRPHLTVVPGDAESDAVVTSSRPIRPGNRSSDSSAALLTRRTERLANNSARLRRRVPSGQHCVTEGPIMSGYEEQLHARAEMLEETGELAAAVTAILAGASGAGVDPRAVVSLRAAIRALDPAGGRARLPGRQPHRPAPRQRVRVRRPSSLRRSATPKARSATGSATRTSSRNKSPPRSTRPTPTWTRATGPARRPAGPRRRVRHARQGPMRRLPRPPRPPRSPPPRQPSPARRNASATPPGASASAKTPPRSSTRSPRRLQAALQALRQVPHDLGEVYELIYDVHPPRREDAPPRPLDRGSTRVTPGP